MKCPCCGYSQKLEYNPSANIQKLLGERTKTTRKLKYFGAVGGKHVYQKPDGTADVDGEFQNQKI